MLLISLKIQSLYNLVNVLAKKNTKNPCLNVFNSFLKFNGCHKMKV
jgi:hypothetical protein